MGIKGKLLALVMALVLMLAVAASAGAVVDYEVIKPSGYSNNYNYPVVYVMPEDGYSSQANDLAGKLQAAGGMDMLIVKPKFTSGMNLYTEIDALIAEVDAKYNTIADPNFRAVVGTNVGGYMAYVLGLTDGKTVQTAPVRFGSIVSIRGDFVSSANPWTSYGSVLTYLKGLNAAQMKNYYVYMDAPVDDTFSNMEGSTNDLGYQIINYGNTPAYNEYTVRPGTFNAAFLNESVTRVADRLTQKMLTDLATANISMGTTVIPSSANAEVNYTVNFADALSKFTNASDIAVDLVLSVVNPTTGEVLTKATAKNGVKVTAGGSMTSSYSSKNINKVVGDSSNVVLSLGLMGGKIELATTTLMRAADPVIDGDYQILSLMGDWKFNFTKSTKLDPTTFTSDTYKDWSVVQPGLGNWVYGYGNINETTVGRPYNGWFDYFIYNNGYYAKEFTVPSNFDADELVLVIGYMDDRGEAWINGKRVGGTGMTEAGVPTGDTTWAVFSYYDIPANLLKKGQTNTIVVRNYNDGVGGGGWYKGPIGIYSKEAFNDLFGTGETDRFYEDSFYSDAVGDEVKYLISLPESYFETERYYPTVYLMHQINSDHTSYRGDAVNEILDAGAKAGIFDEMIVVIPNSTETSWWSGKWEDMVIEDLIPYIDENFRTIKDARYRMTAGCSMGGYGSMAIGLRYPDYFSGVVSFFGAISMGTSGNRPIAVAENTSKEYMDYYSMYFVCGNQDTYKFGQPAIRLNQKLEDMGVEHFFFIENGEHNSAFYVPFFDDAFEYLRKNMYSADVNNMSSIMKGEVGFNQATNTIDVYTYAQDGIQEFFNVIPASKYTKDTNPALNLPLVIEITDRKTGKLVKTFHIRNNDFEDEFDSNFFSFTAEELFGEDVDLGKYSYVVRAAAFDGNLKPVSAPSNSSLPSTGDNSNIFLFAALLMMSVVGMTVMSKKKASC